MKRMIIEFFLNEKLIFLLPPPQKKIRILLFLVEHAMKMDIIKYCQTLHYWNFVINIQQSKNKYTIIYSCSFIFG